MSALAVLALVSLAGWLFLLFARGGFWRADQRLPADLPAPDEWPDIVAVVPARNEAPYIAQSLTSLLHQDYPGRFAVVLVDDDSDDGTADIARQAARAVHAEDRLIVEPGAPPAPGWTGKMAAVARGVARAEALRPEARYLLLTDADIVHAPNALRRLVAQAEAGGRDLVSLMVRLHCRGWAERLLIPAFVFFFQKLFPFPLVNDSGARVAGAAGGCMLVRRTALARAGGIAAIRGALIDDCALAGRLKPGGPIWLGLATESRSIRPYGGFAGIWHMVARTAFTQLDHAPWLLVASVLGMALLYLVPPGAAIVGLALGDPLAAAAGALAWLAMAWAYAPTLRLYGRPAIAGALLPVAGLLYALMTVDSARRHWLGHGGTWKGRSFSPQ